MCREVWRGALVIEQYLFKQGIFKVMKSPCPFDSGRSKGRWIEFNNGSTGVPGLPPTDSHRPSRVPGYRGAFALDVLPHQPYTPGERDSLEDPKPRLLTQEQLAAIGHGRPADEGVGRDPVDAAEKAVQG